MYIHVYTFLQMYIHVYTWYVHGMYILMYKRVCTSSRRVRTCSYNSEHVLNYTNMYIKCTNLYIECCAAHVQCTDGYIHFMKCTDIAEPGTYIDISFWIQLFLFALLAGLLAGTGCCLVSRLFEFKHTNLIGINPGPCQKPFYHPLPPSPPCSPRPCPQGGGPLA